MECLFKRMILMCFFVGAPRQSGLSLQCSNANVVSSRAGAPASRTRQQQQGLGTRNPIHARQTGRAILAGPCSGATTVSAVAYRTAALPRASGLRDPLTKVPDAVVDGGRLGQTQMMGA
jgi:hypothetical protein